MFKIKASILVLAMLVLNVSCSDQLDVKNPNLPSPSQTETESSIYSLAMGSVYINGFQGIAWLGDSYFSLCWGYHELLADAVSAEASNNLVNQINLPEYTIYGSGANTGQKISLPTKGKVILKANNFASKVGNNPLFYEWSQMYALNNSCNYLIEVANKINFASGDADKNAILAWGYFWKGWAYSHIGSLYFAGIINDQANVGTTNGGTGTNGNYVSHTDILIEANKNYLKAITLLSGTVNTQVLSAVIPTQFQIGLGNVPSSSEWIRHIKTLQARNLMFDRLNPLSSPSITGSVLANASVSDWAAIKALATAGIQQGDNVFTGRSTELNPVFSIGTGTVAAMSTRSNSFKISERWVQDFKPGDLRYATNIRAGTYYNYVGGLTFSTRWQLRDIGRSYGGVPPNGSYFYSDRDYFGNVPLYIGSSYEENKLMLAEAEIMLGNTDAGLAHIDDARNYQGAGLSAVAGTGLTKAQALEEVRSERRVALGFRGLSFYDARRWGFIYDVTKGGGRKGCIIQDATTQTTLTNCTINYNFIDFWDVPDNELSINKASAGSAPTTNPNN